MSRDLPPSPPPPARELPPLQAFGRYLIVRKLAEGGMGQLYVARQVGAEGFEKSVVLKVMHAHFAAEPQLVAMFLDEARIAAQLSHPNIVQVHDLGQVDGTYFIAMEHLAGEDLESLFQVHANAKQLLPLEAALAVVLDAAAGLHAAHEALGPTGQPLGVVHRDVSLANLFIGYEGFVKVLDFGIARATERASHTGVGRVKGKAAYMSPEQATAAPVDRRSDVFALAICLHELLTAQRLFQRDTQVATLHALLEPTQPNVASVRADCPPALDAAISRALARDPALRTPTAQAFADELRAATTSLERWSAPQLKAWVHSCVTPERLAARSRVESLASLGWKAPSPPPRRNVALGLAVVGAAFVLTTALFWLLDRGASSTLGDTAARPPAVVDASTPAVVVDSVARAGATPLPVVDAGMAAGPVGAAPQTPAGEDAGAPTSTSERAADAGRPADKPRAVPRALTQQVIERTLNASRVAFEACGRRKGAQLPKSGAITLTLTVLRGGEVSTVSCEAAEAQLCQCMATVAKRVRFPAHTGPAITFSIPVLLTRETPPQR